MTEFSPGTAVATKTRTARVNAPFLDVCLEIELIVGIGFHPNGYLFDNFQAVPSEAYGFFRVIGQEPDLSGAKIG